MAWVRNCGEEEVGLGFVRFTRSLRRKRIVISKDSQKTPPKTTKKQFVRRMSFDSEKSLLESLPRDILIRVLCGVNHDDLKQLFHVSKSVREATLIAKQNHFAYSTPSKTRVFPKSIDFSSPDEFAEIEAPNAPSAFIASQQSKTFRSRMSSKKLAGISVALFTSPNEERWLSKGLMIDTEV